MPGSGCRSPKSLGGCSAGIFLYVEDVDSLFKQAESAGAKVEMPLADQFWGDRYGKVTDPFGHSWSLATHKEDVAPEEMARRSNDAMSKMAQQAHASGNRRALQGSLRALPFHQVWQGATWRGSDGESCPHGDDNSARPD